MRVIWLAVVPFVLATGVTARGQEFRLRKKPNRSTGTWAVQQVQHAETQPGVIVPPPTTITAPAVPAPLVSPVPPAGPVVGAPFVPVVPPPTIGCATGTCATGHCKSGHGGDMCHRQAGPGKFFNWLCYRPSCVEDKYPCGPCCHVPLYLYFGGCHENYHPTALPPCSRKHDLWGNFCRTGHRMFAMPTGHGCGSCNVGP